MVVNGEVGQKVIAAKDLIEEDADGLTRYCVAKLGDLLIIRKIRGNYGRGWAYHVSHEEITDRSFGVSEGEINPIILTEGKGKCSTGETDGQQN
jgi:hypothetical protein